MFRDTSLRRKRVSYCFLGKPRAHGVQVVASSNLAASTNSILPRCPVKRLNRVLRCLCVAGVAAASGALAQGYPAHPVKIVVPFAAGGVADITARVLSQKMGESMGQQVIVENRPSAGGIVASEAVAKAEPDGYTLLFITNGNAVSASLFKSLPYDTVKDFAPVSTVGFFDLVLVVDSASKIGSVRELISYAVFCLKKKKQVKKRTSRMKSSSGKV